MGILGDPLELNRQELVVGHRQAYTPKNFKPQLEEAQLHVKRMRWIFLKPLPSGQMADWPDDLLRAHNEMGDELPEYAAFLQAVCTKS